MNKELDEHDEFRVSVDGGGAKRDDKKTQSITKRLAKRLARRGLKSATKRAHYRRFTAHTRGGAALGRTRSYAQRVVVKTHYVKHGTTGTTLGKLRTHARYLIRDGAGADGEAATFYSAENYDANIDEMLDKARDDRHHFRMIISPENGDQIDDFPAYTREVMRRVEYDLDTQLEWIAVDHFNTDNPHSHVFIRGKNDQETDLVIAPEYVKEGFRNRAQEVATELLRERTLEDVEHSVSQEVMAERFTSLDHRIDKQLTEAREITVGPSDYNGGHGFYRNALIGRLTYLARMGLAEQTEAQHYVLQDNWKDELRSLGRKNDVIKNLYPRHGIEAAQIALYEPRHSEQPITGRVVDKGLDDELYGRTYVVVRDAQERLHYVPDQKKRDSAELPTGSMIRVGAVESKATKTNDNIAEVARESDGIYTRTTHRAHVDQHQAYIPEKERDDYIDAHITRLSSLERSGLAHPLGGERWRVEPDMPERAQAIAERMNRDQKDKKFTRIQVLSDTPIENQREAHADTWLDGEITRRAQRGVQQTFDRDTERAIAQRQRWLVREGYAAQKDRQITYPKDMRQRLRDAELSQTLGQTYGLPYQTPPARGEIEGTYRGVHQLKSGRFAAIEKAGHITAVRVRGQPEVKVGQEITAQIRRGANAMLEVARDRGLG